MGTDQKLETIGTFEAWALTAVLSLGEDRAYGYAVHKEIERCSKRMISLGAVYTTLDRLEAKGMVESWFEEECGRTRKFFKITARGVSALAGFMQLASTLVSWYGHGVSS